MRMRASHVEHGTELFMTGAVNNIIDQGRPMRGNAATMFMEVINVTGTIGYIEGYLLGSYDDKAWFDTGVHLSASAGVGWYSATATAVNYAYIGAWIAIYGPSGDLAVRLRYGLNFTRL